MEIEIDLNKTLEQNAAIYFEKSKLAKRRIAGLQIAIGKQEEKKAREKPLMEKISSDRKTRWYEKYRWFFTSDNFLVIGGKSASANEEVVKKYMKKEDVYFHADVFGAPHCVIKVSEKKDAKSVPEQSMKEAASFAVTFSKAFEQGISFEDAYSVKPDQVSKRAPSGTSMGTGAFMIYGERNYFKKSPISIAIGLHQKERVLMSGPASAVKKWCNPFFELRQGNIEKNDCAKLLKTKFAEKGLEFTNEDILSLLPNGKFDLK